MRTRFSPLAEDRRPYRVAHFNHPIRSGLPGFAEDRRARAKAPSTARLPPYSFLLNDQTEPQKRVARHSGVSLRTLQRYKARGNAPPAVYLTLWFKSRWGTSALH